MTVALMVPVMLLLLTVFLIGAAFCYRAKFVTANIKLNFIYNYKLKIFKYTSNEVY